jgi:hypothetical protein
MPPFQYAQSENPYAASIAELMLRSGDIEAQRAAAVGSAQARAAEASGQAWAGGAQSVGQALGAVPQQTAALRRADIQDQAARLQLGEAQRGQKARSALGQAVADTPHVDEDGMSLYDIPTISKKLEDAGFADHVGDIATQLKGLNDMFRTERQAKLATVQRGAQALLQANGDPDLTLNFLDVLEKNGSWPKGQIDAFRQVIQKDPSKTTAVLQQFAGPSKPEVLAKDAVAIDPNTRQVVASNLVPEKPTEASLAASAAAGDEQALAALKLLKPDQIKPGTVEDWVSRARRLAVVNNGGKPLSDQQQRDVDASALKEFKETNADPELRAASLAQKNLALVMQQMQQAQQPTSEQAKDVAGDIIAHRLAPEQMSSMFGGFGPSGQAFKRMVYTEAKKLDPEFNFEQAASEYALAKNPAFQQTVRYMDYVGESVGNVINAADRLANGKIRAISKVTNWTKAQLNNVDLAKFNTDRLEVADAIAKILQGGGTGSGTSDKKLEQAESLIKDSDDPAVIRASLGEIKDLIGKRRQTLTRGTYLENAQPSKPAAATPGQPVKVGAFTVTVNP